MSSRRGFASFLRFAAPLLLPSAVFFSPLWGVGGAFLFLGGFWGALPPKKKTPSATKARTTTEHRQPGRPHSTTDTRRDHSDPKPGTRKAEPTNQSPKRPGRRGHKRPATKASRPPPTTSSPKPPQETSSSRTRSTAKTNDPARSTRPRNTDNKHSQHPRRDKRRTTASPRRARAPPSKAGWRRPQGGYCPALTALALVGPDGVPAYNGKTRARGGPRLARAATQAAEAANATRLNSIANTNFF